MLVKFGAPKWLSIIIISWGVVAVAFASLRSVFQFYALRLLLGVTESGTFPGMWFHMSLFYSGRGLADLHRNPSCNGQILTCSKAGLTSGFI